MERFSVSRVSDKNLSKNEDVKNLRSEINASVLNDEGKTTNVQDSAQHDKRKFSLAQLTREALPRLDNYRISKRALKRPSLGELHGDPEKAPPAGPEEDGQPAHISHFKLGWIQGVLFPCLLNIWGVMLFLRLSWVVGQSGIWQSLVIIGISATICVITALSLSAICTNGEVKGGGIYYIISRSLGPEFGASVGVVFAIANAVAASMNTIGFCSSLNDLLKSNDLKIIDGGVNDIRLVGVIALLIMIVICAVGMEWEVKAQNVLVVIIVAAMADFMIGTSLGPSSDDQIAKGFIGFSSDVFAQNWDSDYRFSEGLSQNFFTVFAIFFPSVTGVQAGANICGDLKDPAASIPKGTLLSLALSMTSYAAFVLFSGGAALRDAPGLVYAMGSNSTLDYSCITNHTCQFGLQNSYSVMQLMSVWSWLIYLGCFAATLSTALTNLLSVPRLVQALGYDKIYPGVIFFSKGYGKNGEPYRGYVLVFIISAIFVLIADLNAIAPMITNFYLAAYALINFCTFHAASVKPLGWRPTFRFYHSYLSLFACLTCVTIMFMLDWVSSAITLGVIVFLYLLVVYRKPDVNWGSSTQEQTYKTALASTFRLQKVNEHTKNYHPQVLVLSGPNTRPPLVDFANMITKNHSLLLIGDIVPNKISYRARKAMIKEANELLEARKIKGFYNVVDNIGFEEGVRSLIQASGFGKLTPNILMMGYKSDWRSCPEKELITYFNVLHNAFDSRMSVCVLRLPNGLDYSYLTAEYLPARNGNDTVTIEDRNSLKPTVLMHADSNLNLEALNSNSNTLTNPMPPPMPNQQKLKARQQAGHEDIVYATRGGSTVPKDVLDAINIFNHKQPKGTIDVWWLYDDGGLTMLLPYILSQRSAWSNCKIRVFALTNRKQELEIEERNMANLLSKLRVPYSSLIMLQGVTDKPKESSIHMHTQLLHGFLEGQNSNSCFVSNTERKQLEAKTFRQLRIREMLKEHSSKASLVVMSLPMPRQDSVSAPLYMSWLEVLTKDMPPFMLVRGNQTSVLTFYS